MASSQPPRRDESDLWPFEDEYWALISRGVATVEACRLLGSDVGPVLAPSRRRERQPLGRYISLIEWQQATSPRASVRQIAERLRRAPSTLGAELCRNSAHAAMI